MKNIYRLNSISKSYRFENHVKRIFSDFSLEIPNDEITVIIGKSGCGKTTLLEMIARLEKQDSGTIDFYNKDGKIESPKVGMVFQESRLFSWMTVKENAEIHGYKSDRYLDMVGLDKYSEAYPNQLSGGMAQRVAIARALAYNPDTLLMDEPFSALDYFTRNQLLQEIVNIYIKTKIGIIFVTHNIDEAVLLGKRIILLKDGGMKEYILKSDYPRDPDNEELKNIKYKILHDIEI